MTAGFWYATATCMPTTQQTVSSALNHRNWIWLDQFLNLTKHPQMCLWRYGLVSLLFVGCSLMSVALWGCFCDVLIFFGGGGLYRGPPLFFFNLGAESTRNEKTSSFLLFPYASMLCFQMHLVLCAQTDVKLVFSFTCQCLLYYIEYLPSFFFSDMVNKKNHLKKNIRVVYICYDVEFSDAHSYMGQNCHCTKLSKSSPTLVRVRWI